MQGLVDAVMRDVLTRIGGFDECVTEFVRITHTVHSRAIWRKYMPELVAENRTRAGVPVAMQLLGSDAEMMAENALRAVSLGVRCVDINFGCPAPTVNQHQGGAVLLREPKRIEAIVRTLRDRLPENVLLSAKMRLGFEHKDLALDCAQAIESGGAQRLTVHARTKVEAYRAPAHWDWIARIRQHVRLPVVANGDVFSLADYQHIRAISGCDDVMLGRGAVMMPDLARQIAAYNAGKPVIPFTWHQLVPWIAEFFSLCCQQEANDKYPIGRLKQWLNMMKPNYPEATDLFTAIRPLKDTESIGKVLQTMQNMNTGATVQVV